MMTWRELAVLLAQVIDKDISFRIEKTIVPRIASKANFYAGILVFPVYRCKTEVVQDITKTPKQFGVHDGRWGVGSPINAISLGFRWANGSSEDEIWRDFVAILCSGESSRLPLEKDFVFVKCDVRCCSSPEEAYLKACLADARVAQATTA